MAVFKDQAELRYFLGMLYDQASVDAQIGPRIRASGLIVRFRYQDPDDVVTIDTTVSPAQPGSYFDVLWGEQNHLEPGIEMRMKADIAHQFWHGKINLLTALSRRQIIAKGPVPKILRLLPIVEPLYDIYPAMLREQGRDDMVLI